MRTVYEERAGEAREIERKILRDDARVCTRSNFGKCWHALFPPPGFKPAAELASRTGASIRTAEYEISGDHHPSPQSIMALLNEIVPPWKSVRE